MLYRGNMAEIFNLSALCRCCHTDGNFKSLNLCYSVRGQIEVYANMLNETFGLYLNQPAIEASYSICDSCIGRLRNALQFKEQVKECEGKFENYCKNEMALQAEIKIENDLCSDNIIKPEISIKLEDLDGNSQATEYSNTYHVNVQLSDDDCDNEKKELNTDYQQNDYLERQKPDAQTEIQHNDCLENKKTLKKKLIIENKGHAKQKTTIPKAKTKLINCLQKSGNHKCEQSSKSMKVKTDMDEVYICQICKGSFKTKYLLLGHLQKQHSIFTCKTCYETFSTREAFQMHRSGCNVKLECDICNRIFKQRYTLAVHRNMHMKRAVFTCDMCNKSFRYKCSMVKHIYFHWGKNKRCMCDVCGHSFNDRTNLDIHIRAVHEKLKEFKCDQCPKLFSTKKSLKIHLRKHTGERPYKCRFCGKDFMCSATLCTHRKRQHPNMCDNSNANRNAYVCKVCGQHCFGRSVFAAHTRLHAGSKPYKCAYCEKDFTCRYSQKRHTQIHEGTAKKYPCEICHKNFAGKGQVVRHIKNLHSPNKPMTPKVKCSVCKMSVRDMGRHMKTHTGRSLQCSHCPKSYSETSALNRHVREIHSGITHDCNLCDKKYIKAKSLRLHKFNKHKKYIQVKVEQKDARE